MHQNREAQTERALHACETIEIIDVPPGCAEADQDISSIERRARQQHRRERQPDPLQPREAPDHAQIELVSGAAELLALVEQPGQPPIADRHQVRRRVSEGRVIECLQEEAEIHRLEALGEAVETTEADLTSAPMRLVQDGEDLHLHPLDAGRLRRAVEMLEEVLDLEPDHRSRRPAGAVTRWREPDHALNPSSTLPWPTLADCPQRPPWISFRSTL